LDEAYGEMSNASESPCTDSAGEKLNTKSTSSRRPVDLELLASFEEVDGTLYSFDDESNEKVTEEEEDETGSSSSNFNFRLFHEIIDKLPKEKKKLVTVVLIFENSKSKKTVAGTKMEHARASPFQTNE
jgi:hypothetical protein